MGEVIHVNFNKSRTTHSSEIREGNASREDLIEQAANYVARLGLGICDDFVKEYTSLSELLGQFNPSLTRSELDEILTRTSKLTDELMQRS